MGQVKRSVMIDAPADEVFGLMTDTGRFNDWVFGFTNLEEGPPTLSEGASFRWRLKRRALTLKPRAQITTFTAPQGFEEEVHIPGLLRGTLAMSVDQQKRRTQLSWVFSYRVIGGPIGVAADWLVAHRFAERAVEQSLEDAKRLLETAKQPTRSGYRRQTAVR